jgi:hypothetical protein
MRRVYPLLGLARRYGAACVNDACTIALVAMCASSEPSACC